MIIQQVIKKSRNIIIYDLVLLFPRKKIEMTQT